MPEERLSSRQFAPVVERRLSGIFYAGLVGALAFAALNAVNFQVHGVAFSPLYTSLIALVGVIPGLIAGAATYLLNRALQVGIGHRVGNGWNWVGAVAGAAVLLASLLVFLPFYVTSPVPALFAEIFVATAAMWVFLAWMAPGRGGLVCDDEPRTSHRIFALTPQADMFTRWQTIEAHGLHSPKRGRT